MEGMVALSVRVAGISWVRRRALLACPSIMPALRDMVRAQSLATIVQFKEVTPEVADGEEWW